MLLNTHRDDAVRLELELAGFDSGAQARALTLSRREYFWLNEHAEAKADEMKNPPLWNVGPSSRLMPFAEARQFELPPDSITVIQIPQNGAAPPAELKPAPTAAVAPAPNAPLELRVPPQLYSGDTAEAWVFSRHMNGAAAIAFPRENGTIRVNGALKSDRSSVRLSEGAGRFLLTATGAGKAEVEVGAGRDRASAKLTLIDSVPRPRVFWEFEDEQPRDMHSHWKLLTDASVRANQRVLRVDLGGDDPSKSKKRELVVLDKLPGRDGLLKENVRGVVFDLKLSPDFRCADRGASVQLVLQSPRNYWMMLGSIALAGHAEWQTHELITQDQALIRAMPEIYNVWFVLNANAAVFGSIYIDRVGFMVR
jgi:hypothetical protein